MKTLMLPLLIAAGAVSACATPPAEPPMEDACQASRYQYLVGRAHDAIPADLPSPKRVYSTDQAVTMDYNPNRLNVIWNHQTHRVESVRCG